MSDMPQAKAPDSLTTPAAIQAVIDRFETQEGTYNCIDVSSALNTARAELKDPTPAENKGAWADVLAFALAAGDQHNDKPWDTYFGPMGSGTQHDGKIIYFPDARQADAEILNHWKKRAKNLMAPILLARYSDLVWDMAKFLAGEKREVDFARSAIDAYLKAGAQPARDLYHAIPDVKRALALAITIDDKPRRDTARITLLTLHRAAMVSHKILWEAYDTLADQPKAGLTTPERDALIQDIEAVLARASQTSDPSSFNPHLVESAANRLITHYRRQGTTQELQRLNLSIARAFEHFGQLSDPMLASMVLQTSMDAFNAAGMKEDAARILDLLERSNEASLAQMTRHEHRVEIPKEVIEQFLEKMIADKKEETFTRIATEFLIRRTDIEKSLSDTAKVAPLTAMIGTTKVRGNRVVADIGSVDDDPLGRLVDATGDRLSFCTPLLDISIARAIEVHSITSDHIADFANRTQLFGDGRFLRSGLSAWATGKHVEAAHILVPQVEAGFRTLVGRAGRPTTKPHPQMKRARIAVTLGEMLVEDTAQALGEEGRDIALHFRTLYADPRGQNLRNDLLHGLAAFESVNAGITIWIIHSLLLLGAWLKPVHDPERKA